jgi:hypothetical protein
MRSCLEEDLTLLSEKGTLYNYDDIVHVIWHRMRECHHMAQQNLPKFKEKQQERVPQEM